MSMRIWLAETRRYLKGAQPVRGALESVSKYLSNRPQSEIEDWSEKAKLDGIDPEVARFVFDFFDTRGVPMGKVRLEDRLEADLQLNKALPKSGATNSKRNSWIASMFPDYLNLGLRRRRFASSHFSCNRNSTIGGRAGKGPRVPVGEASSSAWWWRLHV